MPRTNSTFCSVMGPPWLTHVELRPYSKVRSRVPSYRPRAAHALLHLKDLNAIAVGVSDEAQPRAALADRVGGPLRRDPLVCQPRERGVEVGRGERDVAVP